MKPNIFPLISWNSARGLKATSCTKLADTCKLLEQNSYRFLLNCHTLDRLLKLPKEMTVSQKQ